MPRKCHPCCPTVNEHLFPLWASFMLPRPEMTVLNWPLVFLRSSKGSPTSNGKETHIQGRVVTCLQAQLTWSVFSILLFFHRTLCGFHQSWPSLSWSSQCWLPGGRGPILGSGNGGRGSTAHLSWWENHSDWLTGRPSPGSPAPSPSLLSVSAVLGLSWAIRKGKMKVVTFMEVWFLFRRLCKKVLTLESPGCM